MGEIQDLWRFYLPFERGAAVDTESKNQFFKLYILRYSAILLGQKIKHLKSLTAGDWKALCSLEIPRPSLKHIL